MQENQPRVKSPVIGTSRRPKIFVRVLDPHVHNVKSLEG
jgi:hypothetical protein